MKLLYNIGIRAYGLGIATAGLVGKEKAVQWLEGRRNWKSKLQEINWQNPIWIHASSLGEFEQAKPLIEMIKEKHPKSQILVTFFSPSGYEPSKNYELAESVHYLPLDTKKNAKTFLEITQPQLAIFVKYDFWFNFLKVLQKRTIPTLFFSCNFRPNQMYFKATTGWQRKTMKAIDSIICLNAASKSVLEDFDFQNASICGDTRFDKVIQNAERSTPVPIIDQFKGANPLLILGSSWPEEEQALQHYYDNNTSTALKTLIAPHDICEEHLFEIEKRFEGKIVRHSKLTDSNVKDFSIVLIDSIGMLANLYQYSDIALIGGGFTNDLHNILEACAMENALLYGNVISKYPEGGELIAFGGGYALKNEKDFEEKINTLLDNDQLLKRLQEKSKTFVYQHRGATDTVFKEVQRLLNL